MLKIGTTALPAFGVTLTPGPALASPSCLEARAGVGEALALRSQARQEAHFSHYDCICDALAEADDCYGDAFDDRGAGIVSIELSLEQRSLRFARAR